MYAATTKDEGNAVDGPFSAACHREEIMVEAHEEAKPKKRMTATQSAASIGPMVKEFITGTLRARAEGKQKLAYTFIVCHHEEILRAMDVLPVWTENFAGICGAKRDSERFLQRAESLGLSRSLCTYALCGIGFDQWREESGQMQVESAKSRLRGPPKS